MSKSTDILFDPNEAAAVGLAMRSVECGSLLTLAAAVDRAERLGIAVDKFPWPALRDRLEHWKTIEMQFGEGSVLNLGHPLIERMRLESDSKLRRDPEVFANAARYRATVATTSDLYARVCV